MPLIFEIEKTGNPMRMRSSRLIVSIILALFVLTITNNRLPELLAQESGELIPLWQLRNEEFQGQPAPVERAVVYGDGRVLLVTQNQLFLVDPSGAAESLVEPPVAESVLVISPDGQRAAWLSPDLDTDNLYEARILDTNNNQFNQSASEVPLLHGITGLFLGSSVSETPGILVAIAPDQESDLIDAVNFNFVPPEGEPTVVSFPTRPRGFIDTQGNALVVIIQDAVQAYSAAGELLWMYPGVYRDAVSVYSGKLALLNPDDRINQVDIVVAPVEGGGDATAELLSSIDIDLAVHNMIIAPSGKTALIVGDAGFLQIVELPGDVDARPLGEINMRPLQLQCIDLSNYIAITNAAFMTDDYIALGMLHQESDWQEGSIVVTRLDGNCYTYRFPIANPTASTPGLAVPYEYWVNPDLTELFVVGFTEEMAFLLRVPPEAE